MSAPESIQQLVEKFHYNLNEYKNPKYNETQVRVEFINPFWTVPKVQFTKHGSLVSGLLEKLWKRSLGGIKREPVVNLSMKVAVLTCKYSCS